MIACSIAPTWDSLPTGSNAHAREQKGVIISWILSSGNQVDSITLWKVALDASFTFDVKRPAAQIHAVHHICSLPCVIPHNRHTFPPRPEQQQRAREQWPDLNKLPISTCTFVIESQTWPPPHLELHSRKTQQNGFERIGRAAMQRYAPVCSQR